MSEADALFIGIFPLSRMRQAEARPAASEDEGAGSSDQTLKLTEVEPLSSCTNS